MPKAASTRKAKSSSDEKVSSKKAKKGMSRRDIRRRVSIPCRRSTYADSLPFIDPNAPKRGLSAYMFFANDRRDKLKAEEPGLSFGMLPELLTSFRK